MGKVRVRRSLVGNGVFATSRIAKGQSIGIVKGRYVADTIPGYQYYLYFGETGALDPYPPFKYLNHSCSPNARLVFYSEQRKGIEQGHLELEAIRDIVAGEEICNDYGWEDPAPLINCSCGSSNCRNWVATRKKAATIEATGQRRRHRIHTDFAQILSKNGIQRIQAYSTKPGQTLRRSKRNVSLIPDVVEPRVTNTLLKNLRKHVLPLLRTHKVAIPKSTIHELEENYSEQLPKSLDLLSKSISVAGSPVGRAAKAAGIYDLMMSESIHSIAELVSGFRLDPSGHLQIQCYKPGAHVGPHTDHLPELEWTKNGYIDLHFAITSPTVDHQWLIYEEGGLLRKIENVAHHSAIGVYHLPFWHQVTPLVSRARGSRHAERWLLVVNFEIVGVR